MINCKGRIMLAGASCWSLLPNCTLFSQRNCKRSWIFTTGKKISFPRRSLCSRCFGSSRSTALRKVAQVLGKDLAILPRCSSSNAALSEDPLTVNCLCDCITIMFFSFWHPGSTSWNKWNFYVNEPKGFQYKNELEQPEMQATVRHDSYNRYVDFFY